MNKIDLLCMTNENVEMLLTGWNDITRDYAEESLSDVRIQQIV